jgi:hypothetical protein
MSMLSGWQTREPSSATYSKIGTTWEEAANRCFQSNDIKLNVLINHTYLLANQGSGGLYIVVVKEDKLMVDLFEAKNHPVPR